MDENVDADERKLPAANSAEDAAVESADRTSLDDTEICLGTALTDDVWGLSEDTVGQQIEELLAGHDPRITGNEEMWKDSWDLQTPQQQAAHTELLFDKHADESQSKNLAANDTADNLELSSPKNLHMNAPVFNTVTRDSENSSDSFPEKMRKVSDPIDCDTGKQQQQTETPIPMVSSHDTQMDTKDSDNPLASEAQSVESSEAPQPTQHTQQTQNLSRKQRRRNARKQQNIVQQAESEHQPKESQHTQQPRQAEPEQQQQQQHQQQQQQQQHQQQQQQQWQQNQPQLPDIEIPNANLPKMSDVDDHQDSAHEEELVQEETAPSPAKQNQQQLQQQQQQQQGNSKKAQRTRRAKLQQEKAQQQAAAATPKVTERKKKAAVEEEEEEDDTELEDEEEYDEGPSQVLIFFTNAFSTLVSAVRTLFGLFCGVFMGLFHAIGSFFSLATGFGLFFLILYVFSAFLISSVPSSHLQTFSARLLFVLQTHSYSILPLILGLLGKQCLGGNAHTKYSRDVIEQTCVLFVNTAVYSTYMTPSDAHWLWTALLLLAVFRTLQWIGICTGISVLQRLFGSAALASNIVLGFYNVWSVTTGDRKA